MINNERQKENATILNMMAEMANTGTIINETRALLYIGGFLGDISKSLAIIADSVNDSKLSGSEQERWLNGE